MTDAAECFVVRAYATVGTRLCNPRKREGRRGIVSVDYASFFTCHCSLAAPLLHGRPLSEHSKYSLLTRALLRRTPYYTYVLHHHGPFLQYYFPMADGSGIKVTVAKYLTPGPYDITKKGGLQPDIACADFPHAPPPPPSATVATTTAGVDSTFPPGSSSSRRAAQAATRAALDADRCLSIAADRVARRALLPASAAMLPPPPLSP